MRIIKYFKNLFRKKKKQGNYKIVLTNTQFIYKERVRIGTLNYYTIYNIHNVKIGDIKVNISNNEPDLIVKVNNLLKLIKYIE